MPGKHEFSPLPPPPVHERDMFSVYRSEASDLNNMEENERLERIQAAANLLREELATDPESAYLVRAAYVVGRTVSDAVLRRGETDDAVNDMYDGLGRGYAETNVEFDNTDFLENLNGGAAGGYTYTNSRYGGEIKVLPSALVEGGDYIERELGTRGIQLQHPQDARLIMLMDTIMHEAGHATLSDLGMSIPRSQDAVERMDLAALFASSAVYMRDHPEKAYMGQWDMDVFIHEERFAEGYSRAGMQELVRALGYSQQRTGVIMDMLKDEMPGFKGKPGRHVMDFIPMRPGMLEPVGAKMYMSKAAIEIPNQGLFGYSNPLTLNELKEQMRHLVGVVEAGEEAWDVDGSAWSRMVKETAPDKQVKRHVKDMRRGRRNEFHPIVNRAKQTVVAGAAILALTQNAPGETVPDTNHELSANQAVGKLATAGRRDKVGQWLFSDEDLQRADARRFGRNKVAPREDEDVLPDYRASGDEKHRKKPAVLKKATKPNK